ncbi:hypothetical protein BST61_g8778 [Cercospora zeina]
MYPEILPEIRKAIKRRYEMNSYIYGLMLESHLTAEPPQRWVGWGYEQDLEVWTNRVLRDGEQQYWFGDSLLVCGVYEPGVSAAKIYAPKQNTSDPGFLNLNAPFQHLRAGEWHTVASPWRDSIPLLARVGGAVPVGTDEQVLAPGDKLNEADLPADDWRGVEIFPPHKDLSDGAVYTNEWYEDDSVSPPPAKLARFSLSYAAMADEVTVSFTQNVAAFSPPWITQGFTIILPVGDAREVVSGDGKVVLKKWKDVTGRRSFHLAPPP